MPNAFRLLAALFAVSVVTARFDAVLSILFLSVVAVVSSVTPNAARLSFVVCISVMACFAMFSELLALVFTLYRLVSIISIDALYWSLRFAASPGVYFSRLKLVV